MPRLGTLHATTVSPHASRPAHALHLSVAFTTHGFVDSYCPAARFIVRPSCPCGKSARHAPRERSQMGMSGRLAEASPVRRVAHVRTFRLNCRAADPS